MQLNMTKGKPLPVILMFTVPLIIGNVFQQLYNMVDTIIVGRYVGADALAAVGSTGTIMFLITGFSQGITCLLYTSSAKLGVLLVDMNYSSMEQLLEKANTGTDSEYLYLMDADGEIIYHPKQKLIYAGLYEENNMETAN